MPQTAKNRKAFAAQVRFLHEKRLWSFGLIGRRYFMSADQVEDAYDWARRQGIRAQQD